LQGRLSEMTTASTRVGVILRAAGLVGAHTAERRAANRSANASSLVFSGRDSPARSISTREVFSSLVDGRVQRAARSALNAAGDTEVDTDAGILPALSPRQAWGDSARETVSSIYSNTGNNSSAIRNLLDMSRHDILSQHLSATPEVAGTSSPRPGPQEPDGDETPSQRAMPKKASDGPVWASARTLQGVCSGVHVWDVTVESCGGTSGGPVAIGVTQAAMHSWTTADSTSHFAGKDPRQMPALEGNCSSWAWLSNGELWCNGQVVGRGYGAAIEGTDRSKAQSQQGTAGREGETGCEVEMEDEGERQGSAANEHVGASSRSRSNSSVGAQVTAQTGHTSENSGRGNAAEGSVDRGFAFDTGDIDADAGFIWSTSMAPSSDGAASSERFVVGLMPETTSTGGAGTSRSAVPGTPKRAPPTAPTRTGRRRRAAHVHLQLLKQGDVVTVTANVRAQTLEFSLNGCSLGVAFGACHSLLVARVNSCVVLIFSFCCRPSKLRCRCRDCSDSGFQAGWRQQSTRCDAAERRHFEQWRTLGK
jgi:hypothetical protein